MIFHEETRERHTTENLVFNSALGSQPLLPHPYQCRRTLSLSKRQMNRAFSPLFIIAWSLADGLGWDGHGRWP